MSLEQKIKELLEGTVDANTISSEELIEEIVEIEEGEAAADNAKINAGKSRKLEASGKDPKDNTQTSGDGGDAGENADNAKINAGKSRKLEAYDAGDDVAALAEGEDLSEEFKQKAQTIFEAAVNDAVTKEVARLEEEHAQQLDEAVETIKAELVEDIDGYLTKIVEQWMQDNQLALERGIKVDIVENFIDGLKGLFNEHYIEVPEEKYNVLDEQAEKIEELTATLEEAVDTVEALTSKVEELTKIRVMEAVGDSLTDTEYEKFAGLCENIEFVSEEDFNTKAQTIKESYFPKGKGKTVIAEQDTPVPPTEEVNTVMSKYVNALSGSLTFKRN